jgi:hypothetical protein
MLTVVALLLIGLVLAERNGLSWRAAREWQIPAR